MKPILIVLSLIMMLGCATSRTTPDPDYLIYQEALKNQKPLVLIEWNPGTKEMTKLEVNPQINIQQKAPDAPHPVWAVVNTALKGAAMVFGIYAVGDVTEGIAQSVQGNSSYTSGGNMAGADMSIPTTTTTTTTNTETMTGTPIETLE